MNEKTTFVNHFIEMYHAMTLGEIAGIAALLTLWLILWKAIPELLKTHRECKLKRLEQEHKSQETQS